MKLALGLLVLLAACHPKAPVGVSSTTVPPDSGAACGNVCQTMGMTLDSVVVMANNVGCVCAAHPPASLPPSTGAAAGGMAGGMAAILLQQEAEADQRRRHGSHP